MHTFHSELPKGYQLKARVDSYQKTSLLKSLLRAFAVLGGALVIVLIPLTLDPSYDSAGFFILVLILFGVPATVIYSGTYALIQWIIYKRATGEVGTFSYEERLGYYSLQRGFVTPELTRRATLLPDLFLGGGLILTTVIFYFIYQPLFLLGTGILALHLFLAWNGNHAAKTAKNYIGTDALISDAGRRVAVFVKSGELDEHNEETESYLAWLDEHVTQIENEKETSARSASIFCIILCALVIALNIGVIATNIFGVKYPVFSNIFKASPLYFVVCAAVFVIYCALTYRMHKFVKHLISIFIIGAEIVLLFVSALTTPCISRTTDISSYGNYDKYVGETEHFPAEITEDMTPVEYSYFFEHSWDYVWEVYLEVRPTDGAYAEEKAKYADELIDAWYAEGYEEYIIEDSPFIEDIEDNPYFSNPTVKKVVFNDTTRTVIYVSLYGYDPLYLDDSAYYNKFNFAPVEYNRIAEERREQAKG